MMFNRAELERMRKDNLIELVLKLQEECGGRSRKSLYEAAGQTTKLIDYVPNAKGSKTKYVYTLMPGDVVKIETEKITPSGYPESGTRKIIKLCKLKEVLPEEKYNELLENGWNDLALHIIDKYIFD